MVQGCRGGGEAIKSAHNSQGFCELGGSTYLWLDEAHVARSGQLRQVKGEFVILQRQAGLVVGDVVGIVASAAGFRVLLALHGGW